MPIQYVIGEEFINEFNRIRNKVDGAKGPGLHNTPGALSYGSDDPSVDGRPKTDQIISFKIIAAIGGSPGRYTANPYYGFTNNAPGTLAGSDLGSLGSNVCEIWNLAEIGNSLDTPKAYEAGKFVNGVLRGFNSTNGNPIYETHDREPFQLAVGSYCSSLVMGTPTNSYSDSLDIRRVSFLYDSFFLSQPVSDSQRILIDYKGWTITAYSVVDPFCGIKIVKFDQTSPKPATTADVDYSDSAVKFNKLPIMFTVNESEGDLANDRDPCKTCYNPQTDPKATIRAYAYSPPIGVLAYDCIGTQVGIGVFGTLKATGGIKFTDGTGGVLKIGTGNVKSSNASITVTEESCDLDLTITGCSSSITVVTNVSWDGSNLKQTKRTLTIANGIVTDCGSESDSTIDTATDCD